MSKVAAVVSPVVLIAVGCGGPQSSAGPNGGVPGSDAAGSDSPSTIDGGGIQDGGGGGDGAAGGDGGGGACGQAANVPAAERTPNGNPILPPKWAFGILWGSYDDQSHQLQDATNLRANYSGDLLFVDSSWNAVSAQDVCFQWSSQFPDPATMIQTLHQSHFHFGVWDWPWMGHGCQYWNTAVSSKYFVMNGSQPAPSMGAWHGDPSPAAVDFTSPAAVTWWQGLSQTMVGWGLDFLKLDGLSTAFSLGSPANATDNYMLDFHRAAYGVTQEYAAANDPNAKANGARGFIIAHADQTAAGNDQFPGLWTNDQNGTWQGLTNEVRTASQMNTTQTAAYWCGDTTGYSGSPNDEVYSRWLEYSTFTPIQQFFGAPSTWPWLYGAQAQQIQKTYAQLRYSLLPFFYSNAQIAYHLTPVAYPVTWVGSTQLLVGNGSSVMLVQPVTAPGVTSASVDLPAGAKWIHYFTGQSYAGGTTANVPAPIDQVPLFVKAGSIIPMGPVIHYVDEAPADPLTLDIYPSGSTSYVLYEDDGVTEAYLGGAYSTTKFTSDDTSGHEVVTIGAQAIAKYPFAGQLCSRTYILEIHLQASSPTSVTRDGSSVPTSSASAFGGASQGWYYDSAAQTVWVKFPLSSTSATTVNLQ